MTALDGAVARPPESTDPAHEYDRVVRLVAAGNVVVLSGAGLSTESGIPDYRGPDGRRRAQPMTYSEFLASAAGRRRYWARGYAGWRRFASAEPNEGHRAVARLQHAGLLRGIITQNVDGLHQRAGAFDVVELHGGLGRVVCLGCGETTSREEVHRRLAEANPRFGSASGVVRPDGDVVLDEEAVAAFHPPRCVLCGSDLLKPDVVFFGETVPKPLVAKAFELVEGCSGLIVLGSSLQVMSGFRFVRRAAALRLPVAIVTLGWSRGDAEASIRLDAPLGPTLSQLVRDLAA